MDANESTDPTVDETPPGPSGSPLVRNTFQFLQDPFAFYDRCREDYDSDVVSYVIAGNRGYMLTHPDDIERVLVTDAADFRKGQVITESLGRLVPNGLVVTEGQQWQRDRTVLQPQFYRERVERYAETMATHAAATADRWTTGDPIVLQDELKPLTMRILAKTLLDVDLQGRMDEIATATNTILERFDSRTLTAFLPMWLPLPGNFRAKRAVSDFRSIVDDLLAERRREFDDLSTVDPASIEREDLLTLLLTATYPDGSRMDEATIRDQLMTFLVAGHETTALTLTYALYSLANHPGKQARLRDELDAEISGEPGAGDVRELAYLDAVLSEALRLYPPAFVVLREPATDVTIRGYDIPAGSVVSLPQWNVHRDSRWWDDPESFRPARWLDEEATRPEYAYFPFGGGPRHCIGMRFAMLEVKLVLSTLLSRYQFEPATEPPLSLRMALTLQPDEPVTVMPRQ